MTSRIRNITVDCADDRAVAAFWAEALGWNMYFDDDPGVLVAPTFPTSTGPGMLFLRVPEGKTVKNRMHVDLQPTDHGREQEVERLVALGATIVEDHRKDDGRGWVWMADPEGNDFCVELGAAERTDGPPQHWYVTQRT